MRYRIAFVALFLALVPSLEAESCRLDGGLGATLLLPYFEVDLDRPNGLTTFFTVHNASPERVLVNVVLWTDAAYPTLGFEVDLAGYELQAINLREVFAGRLPEPVGLMDPPSCILTQPPVQPFADFLRAAHTGQPAPRLAGQCAGFDHDDNVARGYVTVDVVDNCTDLLPSDPGYFAVDGDPDAGVAGDDNVLWGDFFYFDRATGRSEGDLLVSLGADRGAFGPGDLTFYGRYVGSSGVDGREPLPTLWSNRFLGGGPLAITSRSIVWRDTGAAPEAFDCGEEPSWYPLPYNEVISFDEQGNAVFLSTDVVSLLPLVPPFPEATQLGIGFRSSAFGWEILDLNPSPSERRQSYAMELVEAAGGASYLRAASPLDAGCSVAGCAYGDTAVRRVCLTGSEILPGEPVAVEVFPLGCFSSSCTVVYRTLCQVREGGGGLEVEASFCLRDVSEERVVCTDDCGGGGVAECTFAEGLAMGDHKLRLGEIELDFSVPMELPPEGLCAEAGAM